MNKHKISLSVLRVAIATSALVAADNNLLSLPQDFGTAQGENGVFYLEFGDTRPVNVTNSGPSAVDELVFDGIKDFGNGSVNNIGPAFISNSGFTRPYVLLDTARDVLLLHPGSNGNSPPGTENSNFGSAVSFVLPRDGVFRIQGIFARANDAQGAGNGVDVAVYRNFTLDAPLASSTIESNNFVDPDVPFSGTGVFAFDVALAATAGESLNFAVFSDSQGQTGNFDATALMVQVTEIPEPCSALMMLFASVYCLARGCRMVRPRL